jgi:[ribosomal protein S5]-alanine N-acetyltransferase
MNEILSLPMFETERLILKSVTKSDITSYIKYFVDYDVVDQLSAAVPWPYPDDGVEWFLNNVIWPNQGLTRWTWGLFEKSSSDELIGCVDLWRVGHPENRGFWLGKKFWNKGYMSEAVQPITKYAFEYLNFDKLVFTNAVGNLKSRRIKEKTGCRLIDIQPAKFVNPKYTEHEIWELTKFDWLNTINSIKQS